MIKISVFCDAKGSEGPLWMLKEKAAGMRMTAMFYLLGLVDESHFFFILHTHLQV